MSDLVPACVWRAQPEVIVALDDRFGEPVDAYVNGSQVWIRDDGPTGIALEWRLHPVAGYGRPPGVGTYEVFSATALALATGAEPPAPLAQLWDGLEAWPMDGDETEPGPLAEAVAASLGMAPDAFGLVDHEGIGDRWEATGGGVSVIADLMAQLDTGPARRMRR
ncbi:MAG: hypothetical protein M3063_06585 [Actinomycetota bacterium]|nr:hypothetical protein [Actinomycetota bacterium]